MVCKPRKRDLKNVTKLLQVELRKPKSKLTDEEMQKLLDGLETHGKNYKKISQELKTKDYH